MRYCKNYCGLACVDGSCPNAIYESCDYADDIGLKSIKCEDCWKYKGCTDCINNSPEYGRVCDMQLFQELKG